MAPGSSILLFGDDMARQLGDRLLVQSKAAGMPLWVDWLAGGGIRRWVGHVKGISETIKKGHDGTVPVPTVAIVALGTGDILSEPDNASQSQLDALAADVVDLANALAAEGFKRIYWVLPPSYGPEHKARGVIASAAKSKGVRVLDPATQGGPYAVTDKAEIQGGHDLTAEGYDRLASVVGRWIPILPPGSVPLTPRHPAEEGGVSSPAGEIVATVRKAATGRNLVYAAGALAIGGGVIYMMTKKKGGGRGSYGG